jgi:hypothetical protein
VRNWLPYLAAWAAPAVASGAVYASLDASTLAVLIGGGLAGLTGLFGVTAADLVRAYVGRTDTVNQHWESAVRDDRPPERG